MGNHASTADLAPRTTGAGASSPASRRLAFMLAKLSPSRLLRPHGGADIPASQQVLPRGAAGSMVSTFGKVLILASYFECQIPETLPGLACTKSRSSCGSTHVAAPVLARPILHTRSPTDTQSRLNSESPNLGFSGEAIWRIFGGG